MNMDAVPIAIQLEDHLMSQLCSFPTSERTAAHLLAAKDEKI